MIIPVVEKESLTVNSSVENMIEAFCLQWVNIFFHACVLGKGVRA